MKICSTCKTPAKCRNAGKCLKPKGGKKGAKKKVSKASKRKTVRKSSY